MTHEFVHKYRPRRFEDFVGQKEAVSMFVRKLADNELPHAILISGPSGTGKTTLARILARKVKCAKIDLVEINAAQTRGIDMVRDISSRMNLAPMGGTSRVWILDEIHMATKEAQHSFLKALEEPPKHVYFMLATTDPNRLLKTIRGRCTKVNLKPIPSPELKALLNRVCKAESIKFSATVKNKIVKCADGSARELLVFAEGASAIDGEKEQLTWIEQSDPQKFAIDLARALMFSRVNHASWLKVCKIIDSIQEDGCEGLRRMVLAYASKVIQSDDENKCRRAYAVLCEFKQPFYNSGKSDLLAAACGVFFG